MRAHVTTQPGNPSLTKMLAATDNETVEAYCSSVRRRVGMPDHIMFHLFDDMAVMTDKLATFKCSTLRRYGVACEHGSACPDRVAVG